MNNYLIHLLSENKTIIIPGFGALTITNESTGEIMFMPYLKFNDGTLIKHIMQTKNVDESEAENSVLKFVKEVQIVLDSGSEYQLKNFGSFKKINGEIVFIRVQTEVQKEDKNETPLIAESEVEKIITTTSENQEPSEKLKELDELLNETPVHNEIDELSNLTLEEVAPSFATEISTIPQESIPTPENHELESEIVTTAQKIENAIESPIKDEIPEDQELELKQNTENHDNNETTITPIAENIEVPLKTGILSYFIYGFIVLLLGCGTYIAINYNSLKKDFPILADLLGENEAEKPISAQRQEPQAIPEPIPEENIVQEEDTIISMPVQAENSEKSENIEVNSTNIASVPKAKVQKQEVKPASNKITSTAISSGEFHLIAGSFGSENNAKRLAENLKAKGHKNVKVGSQNGMYRVSVNSYATKEEATKSLESLRENIPGIWILQWK